MAFVRRILSSGRTIFRAGPVAHRASPSRPSWNLVGRRGYASGGHGEHKSSSDMPWALGSVAVGAPACAYLWMNGTPRAKGHDHEGHEGHEEQEESTEESQEDGSTEESQDGEDDAKQSESEGDSREEPKQDSEGDSKMESHRDMESGDSSTDEESGHETPNTSDDEADEEGSEDKGTAAQESGGGDSVDKLRGGKKNALDDAGQSVPTHAKHSASPHEDGTKGKKVEGLHDSSRVLQPIDPYRPARPDADKPNKGSDE